uniref:Uncharacterized protein LOC105127482 n=1 Tax=Rhizophora mucronata TaxID=61149 RepID=A0A2P2JL85_RHIMU
MSGPQELVKRLSKRKTERLDKPQAKHIPVEVMTGSMFACLERASMHSSLVILKIRHFSIRCWTMCMYEAEESPMIPSNSNIKNIYVTRSELAQYQQRQDDAS